jgi:hypothetical protein
LQTLTEALARIDAPMGMFDETVVHNLFRDRGTGAQRALVHRAAVTGEILRLRPGLYCLAEPWRRNAVHPFALASVLLAPSHISVESALRHHGLIPEAVRETASVTPLRSRRFDTPLGRFSFATVPCDDPRAGVRAEEVAPGLWAFIATPLRAIADLVYLRPEIDFNVQGTAFISDSLRIEMEDLLPMDEEDVEEIAANLRSRRAVAFIQGLFRELGK